jgi:hypothetical protein
MTDTYQPIVPENKLSFGGRIDEEDEEKWTPVAGFGVNALKVALAGEGEDNDLLYEWTTIN